MKRLAKPPLFGKVAGIFASQNKTAFHNRNCNLHIFSNFCARHNSSAVIRY